jgi:hypothetical protein
MAGVCTCRSKAAPRSWIFRYSLGKRNREMGLGSLSAITLADARAMARKCRRQCFEGIDPVEARNAERSGQQTAAARAMTFDQCTVAYIAIMRARSDARAVCQSGRAPLTARVDRFIG